MQNTCIIRPHSAKQGFTLIEIMIVVVIIGLLAAMAIPAFQKVRENSINSAMDNDASQIVNAINQYLMTEDLDDTISIDVGNDLINNDEPYMSALSNNVTVDGAITIEDDGTFEFTLEHPLVDNRTYDQNGRLVDNGNGG